jgi:ABC-type transport system involved in cytochrome bd biosynthesis fused ATPase/permease subunit
VQQALDVLLANPDSSQTVIVIAQRLSAIVGGDEIICLQKGEVVERGRHENLLEMNGVYKALVNRQLAGLKSSPSIVSGEEDSSTKNEKFRGEEEVFEEG